jgi:transposase
MNDAKYIGLDVHQATISVAVLDCSGKLVMEAIVETKAETILQCMHGLRGSLHVTLEEGTWAAWLHDLLKPHVSRVLVSDPRKNDLGRDGNRNDRRDARELAELLYRNKVKAVYHREHGLRTLKELARSYLTITRDLTRVMTRLKAIYRSWAIPCAGPQVYALGHRAEWLAKLSEPGVALLHIALAPRKVLGVPRVDEIDFEAAFFEHFIEGNPVHPGGLHRHRLHATTP